MGGWLTLLDGVCMRTAGTSGGTHLYWTLVSIVIGTNSTHLDVPARAPSQRYWICLTWYSRDNGVWLPLSAVKIAASSSRRLEVDSLDGAAKGEGETDERLTRPVAEEQVALTKEHGVLSPCV